jgi:hypothetical protein
MVRMRVGVHDHFKGPSSGFDQPEKLPPVTLVTSTVHQNGAVVFRDKDPDIDRARNIPGRSSSVYSFQLHETTSGSSIASSRIMYD